MNFKNKLIFDGWPLGMGGVGVGSFAMRLLTSLNERKSELAGDMLILLPRYFESQIPRSFRESLPLGFVSSPKTIRPLLDQAVWQQRLGHLAEQTDSMLFCSGPFWSIRAPRRTIVCHHDRIFHYWPQYLKRSRFRRWLVKKSEDFLPRAAAVMTGANYAKEEILTIPGLLRDRIEVIYHWLTADHTPEAARAAVPVVKEKYGLPDTYFLYVGGYDLRKNIHVMLEAYSRVLSHRPPPIVLTGKLPPAAPYYCDVKGSIEKLNLSDEHIRQPGFVASEDMPGLYAGASLLIYPSAHEGFGLPPMEAMGCGCTSICADNTSLPEVVTDSEYRFDADTSGPLADLLKRHIEKPLPFNPSFQRDRFAQHTAVSKYISLINRVWELS